MHQKHVLNLIFVVVLALSACTDNTKNKNSVDLGVKLSADSSSVVLSNLPADLINELGSENLAFDEGKRFFEVYQEPVDPDLRDLQKPLTGIYQVKHKDFVFTPHVPFEKGKAYFVLVFAKNLSLNPIKMLQKNSWQIAEQPLEYKFSY
jgi:hypothetical protein